MRHAQIIVLRTRSNVAIITRVFGIASNSEQVMRDALLRDRSI
ncbi:hypothetical protein HMPREF0591_5972 [Mycobacterium parascrofulaceum ATCC BAA-614]|uniref:Uncharacterized protein n=1 Tax=Mycobacterium parascrofulaceum ATCC BAA-614 TaxID=525368 RepID=D5PIH8_9MYCO|nr:hypothetical protein HMPREF0591_5972 [Mycobacterium parascrofulaceum ATCC BAA-614]